MESSLVTSELQFGETQIWIALNLCSEEGKEMRAYTEQIVLIYYSKNSFVGKVLWELRIGVV
jgi:hypothetical protein